MDDLKSSLSFAQKEVDKTIKSLLPNGKNFMKQLITQYYQWEKG